MSPQGRRNLLLAIAFLAGCAASRVQWIPPALAQSDTTTPRWDYHCLQPTWGMGGSALDATNTELKAAGQQGWELVTTQSNHGIYCFKRPLR
ncbi:hypothetical protein P2318_17575 [Myxococcaceae bacterium GXIMD 01537]